MTITTFTTFPDSGTTATLKSWSQGISTALDTIGNPRTTDTGQTDFATFNAVPAVGTYPINEIRRFNDSLQSAAPIIYKIEMGSLGNVNIPSIRLTVGTSSNGAGVIGGNRTIVFEFRGSGNSNTLTANSLLSGASNRVVAAVFGDGNSLTSGMHFSIERTKDSLGNDTTEGAIVTIVATSTNINAGKINQFLPFIGGVPSPDVLGTIGAINGNGTDGADVITCPNFPFRGSGLLNPGLNVEFYMNGAVNPGTVAPIERYGISRNYYFIGNNTSFTGLLRGNAAWISNSTLAIRWD